MRYLSILMLIFLPAAAQASSAPREESPDCSAEISWVAGFASRNYSGFDVKVTDSTRAAYEALLAELRTSAAGAATTADCDALLGRWADFFRDGHLSIGRRQAGGAGGAQQGEQSPAEIRARFADWERVELTETQARSRLDALGDRRDPIEGIWEALGPNYRVAILRDPRADRAFTMTILRSDSIWWMPGQTKATLSAPADDGSYALRFYMLDHSERAWTGSVRRNLLVLDQGSPWIRVWPVQSGDFTPESYRATMNSAFAARQAAPGTVIVHVPSFGMPRQIDSLFQAKGERIRNAEQLVIDVRGNGGGSDFNFRFFVPLLYTDTIRIVGNHVLATEANIEANLRLAADTSVPEAQRAQIRSGVERTRSANGGWYIFPDWIHTEPAVLERPRRVAIIADRGCASSCEQFLLAARQSAKVTIFGDRSAGILDFGNVRSAQMPEGTLVLNYPTTRSGRVPHQAIDNIGIQPDVRIPDDVIDRVAWVLQRLDGAASR